ncbi:MAG: hypothetical protein LBD44_05635 [Spirochaetaceae bacterium]|jgi:hypothetical protein|nr:hypothetical protein [Spirochaetaceae bacterium]
MKSGKKASIFSDRSAIGSAEELDEYGVWVKSEPEDITFDDSAFLDEIGRVSEVTGIESGFDFDLPGTGTEEVALTSDDLHTPGDSGFDVDFGEETVETAALDEIPADFPPGDVIVDDPGFDMDFGEEMAALDEIPVDFPPGDVIVDDPGLDVDFGEEPAETAALDEIPVDFPPGDVIVDDSGLDVDFGEEPAETAALDEIPVDFPPGDVIVDDSSLDVDFGEEPAETAALDEHDFEISLDDIPDTLQVSGNEISSESVAALSPLEAIAEDSGILSDKYDFEISLDDIPETPQISSGEAEAPETGKAAPAQGESLENELLLKIVSELSTIKVELNNLKEEFSTIRDGALKSQPVISEPEAGEDDFGAETLSAAELDAVLSNVKIEIAEIGVTEDEQPPAAELDLPSEKNEIEVETVTDTETPEDGISVDLDLNETHDEAATAFDDLSGDFDVSESAPTEDIVVPALDEENALPDTVSLSPDYLSPDDLVDINESLVAESDPYAAADIPVESQPALAQKLPEAEAAVQSPHDPLDTPGFKKDLQAVLSYMDKLLEALPDEKIEEFARSEQFDTYKRVFKELGLV